MKVATDYFGKWALNLLLLLGLFSFSGSSAEPYNAQQSHPKGQLISAPGISKKIVEFHNCVTVNRSATSRRPTHASLLHINNEVAVRFLSSEKIVASIVNTNLIVPLIYAPRSVVDLANSSQG